MTFKVIPVDILDMILTRRSIRKYEDRVISEGESVRESEARSRRKELMEFNVRMMGSGSVGGKKDGKQERKIDGE